MASYKTQNKIKSIKTKMGECGNYDMFPVIHYDIK